MCQSEADTGHMVSCKPQKLVGTFSTQEAKVGSMEIPTFKKQYLKLENVTVFINKLIIQVPAIYEQSKSSSRRKEKWWRPGEKLTTRQQPKGFVAENRRARRVPAELRHPGGDDLSLLHLQPTQPPDMTQHLFLSILGCDQTDSFYYRHKQWMANNNAALCCENEKYSVGYTRLINIIFMDLQWLFAHKQCYPSRLSHHFWSE